MPDDCDARNFCFRIVYVTNGVEFARRLISFKNLSTLQSDYRKENKSTSRKKKKMTTMTMMKMKMKMR